MEQARFHHRAPRRQGSGQIETPKDPVFRATGRHLDDGPGLVDPIPKMGPPAITDRARCRIERDAF